MNFEKISESRFIRCTVQMQERQVGEEYKEYQMIPIFCQLFT